MSERLHLDPLPLGGPGSPPYSKGLMARALMVTGLPADRAYELARRIEADLAERRADGLDLDRLAALAVETLGEGEGLRAARRLRRYRDLAELDAPVILLVGGGTGTGKSTVATEAAHRLGITRVTSTDFVRQTMRAFFSREFMPSIHTSSFEAALALSKAEEEESGDPALLGFLDQTRNVLVGVEAVLRRALSEGWSMVLEGIHLVPGMIPTDFEDALVVPCVLAIHDEDAHRGHFWIRDTASGGLRPMERYLDNLPVIRTIQDYVVERAARHDVPVIENTSMDAALSTVMELVLTEAERLRAQRG